MEKILLDTNILIYREDNTIVDTKVTKLFRLLYDSDDLKIYIHPMSFKDMQRQKDEELRAITLSKINTYPILDNPPIATEGFHNLVGCKRKPNDEIDNNLLYAVKRNCVSFLITHDRGLLTKANLIGLGDRVFDIEDAISFFSPEQSKNIFVPVKVNYGYFYNLDLGSHFFDSLRASYPEFDTWFRKKSEAGQRCYYTIDDDGEIGSFLAIKEQSDEIESDFDKQLEPGLKIKISTLKVSDRGKHIGERLLKIAFDKAAIVGARQVFITVFEEQQEELVNLLSEYGFTKKTTKKHTNSDGETFYESVYVNILDENGYPKVDWSRDSFIVPVQPQFHHKLFPDAERISQLSFNDYLFSNPYSNAIKKAYICNANTKSIKSGDLLFFYASHEIKGVTAVGVVDDVFTSFDSIDDMLAIAKKRTVYERNELVDRYPTVNSKVIMFKHYMTLDKPISFKDLIGNKIINGSIQSITKVDTDKMKDLVERES